MPLARKSIDSLNKTCSLFQKQALRPIRTDLKPWAETVNAIDPAVPSQPRERKFPDKFSHRTQCGLVKLRYMVVSGHFPIIHNMK